MERGKVKTIKRDKGFGFIEPDSGGAGRRNEVFFHRSSVSGGARFDELNEGDVVGFERGNANDKGPRADFVTTDLGE